MGYQTEILIYVEIMSGHVTGSAEPDMYRRIKNLNGKHVRLVTINIELHV